MPPEGPAPGHAKRGRRNPDLVLDVSPGEPEPVVDVESFLDEAGESSEQPDIVVLPGDVVAMKVVHQVDILGQDAWITMGHQTRVMEGESEVDVFDRVEEFVNNGVLIAADRAYQRVLALQEQHDADLQEQRQSSTPNGRISPRRR